MFFSFDSIMSHFGLIIFSCQFFLSLLVQQLKLSRFLYKKLHVSVKKEENLICMFNVCSCNMLVCMYYTFYNLLLYICICNHKKKKTYYWEEKNLDYVCIDIQVVWRYAKCSFLKSLKKFEIQVQCRYIGTYLMDVFANAKYESIITQCANFREMVHFTFHYAIAKF